MKKYLNKSNSPIMSANALRMSTAPADISLMRAIFVLFSVEYKLHSSSMAVLIPSAASTQPEVNKTNNHSIRVNETRTPKMQIVANRNKCILKLRPCNRCLMPLKANRKLCRKDVMAKNHSSFC